jgi:hypothetical protein
MDRVLPISIVVQTGPKRYGSTFSVYLDYGAGSGEPAAASTMPADAPTGFNYWPSSLLIYIPVLRLDPVVAVLDHDHVARWVCSPSPA